MCESQVPAKQPLFANALERSTNGRTPQQIPIVRKPGEKTNQGAAVDSAAGQSEFTEVLQLKSPLQSCIVLFHFNKHNTCCCCCGQLLR